MCVCSLKLFLRKTMFSRLIRLLALVLPFIRDVFSIPPLINIFVHDRVIWSFIRGLCNMLANWNSHVAMYTRQTVLGLEKVCSLRDGPPPFGQMRGKEITCSTDCWIYQVFVIDQESWKYQNTSRKPTSKKCKHDVKHASRHVKSTFGTRVANHQALIFSLLKSTQKPTLVLLKGQRRHC